MNTLHTLELEFTTQRETTRRATPIARAVIDGTEDDDASGGALA